MCISNYSTICTILCIFPTCHRLYDNSNIPSTPPHLALTSISNICHIDKNRKYMFVSVNVCVLAGFLGFFGAFLGAGIVMFRANLPLHCTRNAHNVERGHRKGECEGGFKWLWRQHLTLTSINQIGGSLYPYRECTLLVIPCQHQGHSSYCIHICMSLDPMRVF